MRRSLLVTLPVLFGLAGACASTGPGVGAAATDVILVTDAQGNVMRRSALNERATVTIAAPVAKVWPALVATYADLGIEANYADQPRGRYGVQNYTFPHQLKGERIATFFSCGRSIVGEVVDAGTVTSTIITTLTAASAGQTTAVIYVTAVARRNEGASSNPISCSSTGKLEEMIRVSMERKAAAM